jgi:putative heme-binding domain-containing protein
VRDPCEAGVPRSRDSTPPVSGCPAAESAPAADPQRVRYPQPARPRRGPATENSVQREYPSPNHPEFRPDAPPSEPPPIGPDLTGGNRGNLDYLLENIIDPGAVVPKQFTVSVIVLNSGRVVTGVIVAETTNTLTVQTDKEQVVVALVDIDERVRTTKSLMPDGLLSSLNEEQVQDLLAFVMKRR